MHKLLEPFSVFDRLIRFVWRFRGFAVVTIILFDIVAIPLFALVSIDNTPVEYIFSPEPGGSLQAIRINEHQLPLPGIMSVLIPLLFVVTGFLWGVACFRVVFRGHWLWIVFLFIWPLIFIYYAFGPTDVQESES